MPINVSPIYLHYFVFLFIFPLLSPTANLFFLSIARSHVLKHRPAELPRLLLLRPLGDLTTNATARSPDRERGERAEPLHGPGHIQWASPLPTRRPQPPLRAVSWRSDPGQASGRLPHHEHHGQVPRPLPDTNIGMCLAVLCAQVLER